MKDINERGLILAYLVEDDNSPLKVTMRHIFDDTKERDKKYILGLAAMDLTLRTW